LWEADRSHSGGTVVERPIAPVSATDDPPLYLTERFDVHSYVFGVANCTYNISLHFAETFFDADGQRTFNVIIEGNTVLSNFDPFAAAGGAHIALRQTFTVDVSDGILVITFSDITNFPMINAIEIVPADDDTPLTSPAEDEEEVTPPAEGQYYVEGNTIFNANGQPHRFYGVSRSGMELECRDYLMTQQDFNRMAAWNANVVRIPLNQDFWLADAALHCPRYADNIERVLGYAVNAGLDVIFDLHWSDAGDLSKLQPGQQLMADQNSLVFWREFATRYANHPQVIFELYNEPHDISWDCWLNGCVTSEGWQAVGMQQLYDTVRSTGANNIVIIGGLDWGYDLSGVVDHRVNGTNIIYATHVYDFAHKQPDDWERAWGFLTDSEAVIVSEFGTFDCTADFYTSLIEYAHARNQTSWIAWAWTASGCDYPSLLQSFDGTPSDPVGIFIQNALLATTSN
jgi:hypothetical protein